MHDLFYAKRYKNYLCCTILCGWFVYWLCDWSVMNQRKYLTNRTNIRGQRLHCWEGLRRWTSLIHVYKSVHCTPCFSFQQLKEAVSSALQSFAAQGVQTAAFPAVGTGGLKYDTNSVADTMVDAITSYFQSAGGTTIQKVYIVVYYDDELCYKV